MHFNKFLLLSERHLNPEMWLLPENSHPCLYKCKFITVQYNTFHCYENYISFRYILELQNIIVNTLIQQLIISHSAAYGDYYV